MLQLHASKVSELPRVGLISFGQVLQPLSISPSVLKRGRDQFSFPGIVESKQILEILLSKALSGGRTVFLLWDT